MAVLSPPGPDVLADRLGIKPLPQALIAEALTHASLLNEGPAVARSNERLEFLGDAILGMVVADELFKHFPDAGEGELTRMRADVVNGKTLARAAVRYELGEFLILGKGEEAGGGRSRHRNLAGLFEAIIGAVYIGHGYRAARAFIVRSLRPEIQAVRKDGAQLDPKSALQHLVQSRWHEPPEYVTVAAGEEETSRFVVEVRAAGGTLARGSGKSKREAQVDAARQAVETMTATPGDEA